MLTRLASAVALLTLVASTTRAEQPSLPGPDLDAVDCSGFQKRSDGTFVAKKPMMLKDSGGNIILLKPGDSLGPKADITVGNSTASKLLAQKCGNRGLRYCLSLKLG